MTTYQTRMFGRKPRRVRSRIPMSLVLLAVIVFVTISGGVLNATHIERHYGCVVTDKDRTSHSDGDGGNRSDARVYTENCGTFRVADSWLSWTFHSADTYGRIEEGHVYDFTTRGFRVPFLSKFPNIVGMIDLGEADGGVG